jgi:hypothetical protein
MFDNESNPPVSIFLYNWIFDMSDLHSGIRLRGCRTKLCDDDNC